MFNLLTVETRPVPLDRLPNGVFRVAGTRIGLHTTALGHALLVCATETRTAADIAAYAGALGELLRAARAA